MWDLVQADVPVTPQQQALLRIAATHATTTRGRRGGPHVHGGRQHRGLRLQPPCSATSATSTRSPSTSSSRLPTYEMLGKIVLGVESDGFML